MDTSVKYRGAILRNQLKGNVKNSSDSNILKNNWSRFYVVDSYVVDSYMAGFICAFMYITMLLYCMYISIKINTLRPRQDGRHFADDIFTCIFFNENCCILIKFSLKYVRKGPIDNNPALVQIMAWRRPGDKPLSEPRMESLLTHICVTRPQWVKIHKLTIKSTEFLNLYQ